MNTKIQTIHQARDGKHIRLAQDLYLFRVPKHQFRHGQSYAMVTDNDELILIDAVHQITKSAVEEVINDHPRVAAMIVTHRDLIGQAFTSIQGLSEWINAPIYAHPADHMGHAFVDITNTSDGFPQLYSLSFHHVPGHTPGSIMIYDHRNRRLFTGDSAVGDKYGSETNDFTHPYIAESDWDNYTRAWQTIQAPVKEVYPLHGKPVFELENFEQLRDRMLEPDNNMQR